MNKQELAFKKLSKLKVGALFMEMGTGKTKVAMDLIASKQSKVDYILWICPLSTKQEIELERQKWHPELIMDIVGCETISLSENVCAQLFNKLCAANGRSFIVVDESLKIKNRDAKRTKRIIEMGKFATYKLILNGTPLSKNVLDLYPQMQFLSPKILNMNFYDFKNNYCEYYLHGKLKNRVKKQYNIDHLVSLIEPYIFDCELDLKKQKRYHDLYYSIDDLQEYDELKRSILITDSDFDFFAVTTTLQHYYCTTFSKNELLKTLINQIDGQVIVFVKYIDSIPSHLKRLTGDMSTQERKNVLESFKNGEFKTLFITYGCGSFGLNLQNCKNIIFADHIFDYSSRLQAEARIYRWGQKYDVDYYNLNCTCGLDELIRRCLDKKTKLLDEVKKEIAKKGLKEFMKGI